MRATTTDGVGVKGGVRKVGWALALAALAGCDSGSGNPTGSTCSNDPTLTWADFAQDFMTEYCTGCHANYGSLDGVRRDANRIDLEAGAGPSGLNDAMPPSGHAPSLAERKAISEWLSCGAP